jgi:hypothetical protein
MTRQMGFQNALVVPPHKVLSNRLRQMHTLTWLLLFLLYTVYT